MLTPEEKHILLIMLPWLPVGLCIDFKILLVFTHMNLILISQTISECHTNFFFIVQ